ncbi:FkbM family methyltransferase [Candidatus Kaiserbacteria bacterium]|nr:FkbM family methyltransferase [Candidatus Kaiserbacteria bacterium]
MIKDALFSMYKAAYRIAAKTPLRKIPGGAVAADFLFRLLGPQREVVAEIQGSKMRFDVNDPNPALRQTFHGYLTNLIHEEETTALFRTIVKPGSVVLDLGANIGYFTLLFSRLVGPSGKVFSFEPEPRNFAYLSKNIEINEYKNVAAFEKAAAEKTGTTQLFVCSYDTGHHTINQYDGVDAYRRGKPSEKRPIDIEMVKLDDFLKDKTARVDVVKMDVEGAEPLATAGMDGILKTNPGIQVVMEFFPLLIEKMGRSPKEFFEQLRGYGFRIFLIGGEYSLGNDKSDFPEVKNYAELEQLIKEPDFHVNFYLARNRPVWLR